MEKQSNLSASEWKLMKQLWTRSSMTVRERTDAMREETNWTRNTIITMLSRLEAKGAVGCEQGVRAKRYYPVLEQKDAARTEMESFLDRVYGGRVGLMMSAMVESRGLSEDDIAELSAILEKAGGKER